MTAHFQAGTEILTPEHRHQLEVESAIPADIIAEEGIYSVGPGEALPVPDPAFRHPNSYKGQRFPTWPVELAGTAAIVFPNWDHDGRPNFRLRPDDPRTVRDDDGNESRPKYEGCGGGRNSVYAPKRSRPKLGDVAIPLAVIEGDKKTLAALGVLGDSHAVVGLSGIDCWSYKPNPSNKTQPGPRGKVASESLPDWDAIPLRTRIVFIVPDSDYATNPNVHSAVRRFERFLKERGAVPVVVELPCKPDGSKMGADDYIANGGDLRRQLHCALYERLMGPKRSEPPTGTDGAETCRACPDKDAIIEAQAEELRAYAAADELVTRGPFTPDAAQVHRQLVTTARAAQACGKERVPLLREELARLALGDSRNVKAVTRAYAAYRPYQDDPELAATLPYRLDWREEGGKTHVDLVVPPGDPERERAQAFRALCRLPKPDDRRRGPNVDGRRHRPGVCPRCNGPQGMERRAVYRCLNDACGHTYHGKRMIVGAERPLPADGGQFVPHKESTYGGQFVPDPDPVAIHGAPFAVEARAKPGPGHFVPATADAPEPPPTLIPVSFVAREDVELFSGGKRWPDREPAPPRPTPPPLPPAPPSHRSWWSRSEYRRRTEGAS